MTGIIDQIDAAVAERCACGCNTALAPDGPSGWFATQGCQHRWAQRHATDPDDVYGRADAAMYPPDPARWVPRDHVEPATGDPHPTRAGYTYQPWTDASTLPAAHPLHYLGRLFDTGRLLPGPLGEVVHDFICDRWTLRLSDGTRTVTTVVDAEALCRDGHIAGQKAWLRLERELATPVNAELWSAWREGERIAAMVADPAEARRLFRIAGMA